MARPRSGFVNRVRTRRQTDWGFGVDVLDQSVSTSSKILGTTSLTVTEQQTIVRIRGLVHCYALAPGGTVGDGMLGAMGIALVNSDAFAAGVASVPGPLTDAHWDAWMWHSWFDLRALSTTLADGANADTCHQRVVIDSKAMRKWDPAETLVLVLEHVRSGTMTMEYNGDSRILLKAA